MTRTRKILIAVAVAALAAATVAVIRGTAVAAPIETPNVVCATDRPGWQRQSCRTPTPTPAPSLTSTPTTGPSPTVEPSATPTGDPSPTATGSPTPTPSPSPTAAGWPGPDNTGVPPGTPLTTYGGPCTITVAGTHIDAAIINCDVSIRADNVWITRSQINGYVENPSGAGYAFRIEDSNIDSTPSGPRQVTGVGSDNFTLLRSEVVGGNRGVYCRRNCLVQDSYVHGQEIPADATWHASGIRLSQAGQLVHNTIWCEAQPNPVDGGCSADQTGYPDFEITTDWLVERNLFKANSTGNAFCAYGGATGGKPYSSAAGNATNIRYIDNVFERGGNRNCAAYGPITDYAAGRPGNVWSGNVWDDGGTVLP